MKIGLYFGTYNPIHAGHLIIASYMAQHTDLDQIWLVVSPQNPLKKSNLLPYYHRLRLVVEATLNDKILRPCNIEFELPKPSYTINTLTYIEEKYPQHKFSIIMGEDNLRTFHKWKNYKQINENYFIYVYPRILDNNKTPDNKTNPLINYKKIKLVDAPIIKISSSIIRKGIKEGKDMRYFLTEPVCKYIYEMNFYK